MTALTKNIIRTEADIKAIKPPATGYVPYRDAEVGGLGLRISSFNKRSWFLMYRCGSTQRTRNLAEWPAMTVKQARAEATQIKLDAKNGIDRHAPPAPVVPVPTKPTLAGLWQEYRDVFLTKVVEIKPTTLGDYDSMWRVWLEPKWGNSPVDAITFEDVAAFHQQIGTTPNKRKKAANMKRRANAVIALLRPLLDWAITYKKQPGPNPCYGLRPFKKVERDRPLLPYQGKRLWAAFDRFEHEQRINPNCIRALRCLLLTGGRETEITELEWAWLDQSEAVNGGLAIVVPDSKTGKITTPLTKALHGVLASIDRVDGNPFVFTSDRKQGAHIDINHDQWQAILKEAKIEDFRIHDLRHTFSTWAMSYAGLSKDEVGSLLNHAGTSVTDIYAKTVLERRLALAEMASQKILEMVQPNIVALEVVRDKAA